MKNTIKITALLLCCILSITMLPIDAKASDTVHFLVQAADVKKDGTMEVIVYMTGADNLGGVEAELSYDSSAVSYVDSQFGTAFMAQASDAYHDEGKNRIKYVGLCSENQKDHGVLVKAIFQLKQTASYQPTLNVLEVVDDSVEVSGIPFDIAYQQADNEWETNPDTSGKTADTNVCEQTWNAYASQEDKREFSEESAINSSNKVAQNVDAVNKNTETINTETTNTEITNTKTINTEDESYGNKAVMEQIEQGEEKNRGAKILEDDESREIPIFPVIIFIMIIVVAVVLINLKRNKRIIR